MAGMMDDALRQSLFSLLADKGAKQIGVAGLSGIVDGDMETGVSVRSLFQKRSCGICKQRLQKHITTRITL